MISDTTLPQEIAALSPELREVVVLFGRRHHLISNLDEADCRRLAERITGPTGKKVMRHIDKVQNLAKRVQAARRARWNLRDRMAERVGGIAYERAIFARRFREPMEIRLRIDRERSATKAICDDLDIAREEIGGDFCALVNDFNVLVHPSREMIAKARDALDRALAVYDATKWRDAPHDRRLPFTP